MAGHKDGYFLPSESHYPFFGSIILFIIAFGGANWLNEDMIVNGKWTMLVGVLCLLALFFVWFGRVIAESPDYNLHVDKSFRMSMSWFIFSEVMFFAAFFGALYYVRQLSIPWLSETELLWPGFDGGWPTAGPTGAEAIAPDTAVTGDTEFSHIGPWGLPLLNTALLLTSSVTCTIAHHAIIANKRGQLIFWLAVTVALGFIFLFFQAEEYIHAFNELGLSMGTGVYGSTFFMLTGFHGFHVCMGAIILLIVLIRCIKGHFTPERHFAFEAGAWYWHFVDVVWVGLFIFVYIL
ncbi:MAG: cytochrome c oxidase subunit 3 [Arenicella sp.]